MRQMLPCPYCGSPNPPGQRFCGACGARVVATCPYCQAIVDPKRRFCPNCGGDLFRAMQQPTQPLTSRARSINARDRRPEGFKSVTKRSQWVSWIFIILMLLCIIAVFSDYAEARLLIRAISGEVITESEATANDARQAAIAFTQSALYLASAIAFLMWVHRAHKNLPSLGVTDLRFTPGWAVGWFFVPIMFLFRPYQAISEIWRASEPNLNTTDSTSWKTVRTSSIVGWWWAFFLISEFAGKIVLRVTMGAEELSGLLASTYAYMAAAFIDVVGIPITILMVTRISQLQETKAQLIPPSTAATT